MTAQHLVIEGWHPPQVANQTHRAAIGIWRGRKNAQKKVEDFAKAAQWRKVEGRARLSVVFVYPQRTRVDTDNLYARCKGPIDAVKRFMTDDSTEWLDLVVTMRVEPRRKAFEMTLEAA